MRLAPGLMIYELKPPISAKKTNNPGFSARNQKHED